MNWRDGVLFAVLVVSPLVAQEARPPRLTLAPAPVSAPAPASIKGLKPPIGPTNRDLIRATLQEMPSGMVIVEGEAESFLPAQAMKLNLVRILEPAYTTVSGIPLAPWMDGPFTISGGNTIAQVFPIGWGYH